MTLRDYKLIFKLAKSMFEQEYHNLSLWYLVSFIYGIVSSYLIILRNNIFGRFISGIIIVFSCGMLVSKYRISNLHVVGIKKPIISQIGGTIESMKPTTHGMRVILYQVKFKNLAGFTKSKDKYDGKICSRH